MARSDPPPGRVALAPPVRPIRGPGGPPSGRGPARPPTRPAANYGRRRLLVVAVVATVAVIGYFVVHSLSGGGSGGAGDDSYLNANHDIAAQGTSMITAGTDLRTMRNIGVFRVSVEASVAKIGTTVAALNRLAADQTGSARDIIRQTVASGEHIAQVGTTYESDVTNGDLGAANRDEAEINVELAKLQQQADAWSKRS
jgi:hypothetical protein